TGAFVETSKPRQINLGPRVCARLDLLRYKSPRPAPAVSLGVSLLAFGREIELTQGAGSPAEATCWALQRASRLSELLGTGTAYGRRLASLLAGWYGPRTLPSGYWSKDCRDGGSLDLDPAHRHWP